MKLLVKNLQKTKKWQFFNTFWPKNPQFWIFPRVPLLTHASRHLGEDLGSFQPKIMKKIEVISQKPSKNWIFGKNGHFWPKNPQFWIFPPIPLLTHASRHLGKSLGSFQPKLMTKIEVISQKPSKNCIFCKKWPFFGQKTPILNFPTDITTQTR